MLENGEYLFDKLLMINKFLKDKRGDDILANRVANYWRKLKNQ